MKKRAGTAGSGGAEEGAEGEGAEAVLRFSLLPSMQPHLSLHWCLEEGELRGYADAGRGELVERLPLAAVARVRRDPDDPRRFRLEMRDGDAAFFEAGDAAAAAAWAESLAERTGEEEWAEPELGMCELHLDVAEEVDVRVLVFLLLSCC